MGVVNFTDEVRAKISRSLAGRPKSQETRARMAASKLVGSRDRAPERWDRAYSEALARIQLLDSLAKQHEGVE